MNEWCGGLLGLLVVAGLYAGLLVAAGVLLRRWLRGRRTAVERRHERRGDAAPVALYYCYGCERKFLAVHSEEGQCPHCFSWRAQWEPFRCPACRKEIFAFEEWCLHCHRPNQGVWQAVCPEVFEDYGRGKASS